MSNKRIDLIFWIYLLVLLNILWITKNSATSLHGTIQVHGSRNLPKIPTLLTRGRNILVVRQRDLPSRYPKKNQTGNQLEKPPEEKGPERNKYYNPSYGYEPYWPGGDWMLKWFVEQSKKNGSHYLCEDRCSKLYEKFGVICGRNKNFEHRTFKNYCEMRLVDCYGHEGWYVAYRGQCKTLQYYPTTHMQSRASYHIDNFYDRHPKTYP